MTKTPNQQIAIAKILEPEVEKVVNKLSIQLDGNMPYGMLYQAVRQGMLTAFELGDDMGWVVRAEENTELSMRKIQNPPKPATHSTQEQIKKAIEGNQIEIDRSKYGNPKDWVWVNTEDHTGEAG